MLEKIKIVKDFTTKLIIDKFHLKKKKKTCRRWSWSQSPCNYNDRPMSMQDLLSAVGRVD